MNRAKKKALEAKGWKVGNVQELLGLSPHESVFVELKLTLSEMVSKRRQKQRLTQVQLAKRFRSSQSRVSKIEAGDSSVSLDLLVLSWFALGASRRDLARVIST